MNRKQRRAIQFGHAFDIDGNIIPKGTEFSPKRDWYDWGYEFPPGISTEIFYMELDDWELSLESQHKDRKLAWEIPERFFGHRFDYPELP